MNGCMAKLDGYLRTLDASGGYVIEWDGADIYDDGNWHDPASNNTKLIVPAGVSRVEVGANFCILQAISGQLAAALITKNGSPVFDGAVADQRYTASTFPFLSLASGPIPVQEGDAFEVILTVAGTTSIELKATRCNFWIKAST